MFRSVAIVAFALAGVVTLAEVLPEEFSEWEGRIVGGSDASENQFPYQVSLRSRPDNHFCGGSIVSERWILSAAHCTQFRTPTNTFVVVGAVRLSTGGMMHTIARYYNHPKTHFFERTYDVALVQLMNPIVFNANVRSIALESEFLHEGTNAQTSGWGITSHPGTPDSVSNQLQWVKKDIIPLRECRERHGELSRFVYDNTICTSSPEGVGACLGDSGGPLTHNGRLQGIVSWGIACARGYPDVYARVSSHRHWILETIKKHS